MLEMLSLSDRYPEFCRAISTVGAGQAVRSMRNVAQACGEFSMSPNLIEAAVLFTLMVPIARSQ